MANPDNNNASDEEKIDPMKDVRAGIVREVGSQAIWSLSSCKPGKVMVFNFPRSLYLINLSTKESA